LAFFWWPANSSASESDENWDWHGLNIGPSTRNLYRKPGTRF
jgi:hypothetical protein